MITHDLLDEDGRVYAFEVDNVGLGRKGVCSVVETIPGARISRRPKPLSWFREEVFCEFSVDGVAFVAWEPFGDSSRYWIGPEPPEWRPQTQSVRDAFAVHKELRVFRRIGFVLGALTMAAGLKMFGDAEGGAGTISAISVVVLGALFLSFAFSGQRSFPTRKRRR